MSFLIFEATNFQSNFDEWLESFGQQIVSAHSVTEWNFILTHTHTHTFCMFFKIWSNFSLSANPVVIVCASREKFELLRLFVSFCYEYISLLYGRFVVEERKRMGGGLKFPWNGFHLLALIMLAQFNRTKILFIHLL